jgi:hypothetical protein
MKQVLDKNRKRLPVIGLVGSLLFTNGVVAEEDWGFDLEAYGWLPNIEMESESGEDSEITRDDIIDNLDMAAMWAARARNGKWSLTADFIYFKLADNDRSTLIPGLLDVEKVELKAWIVTPNIGYTVVQTEQQQIDFYAGARYIWIEADLSYDSPFPLLPGDRQNSDSAANWDAVVGVRGNYRLSDKWYIPYSINAGSGQSDFTWQANGAFAYRFSKLDAVLGWRYLDYDFGDDTAIKDLTVNGPFVGAIFHW